MRVTVRPAGVLREFLPGAPASTQVQLNAREASLGEVCATLGIDVRLVTAVVVNGGKPDNRPDLLLHDGDDVLLIPYLAGG